MLPSPDILNEFEHGKFVLSNLAAMRAKQLRGGAPALVAITSTHPLTIALAEIAAGKIKPKMVGLAEILEPQEETAVLIGEDRPAELGILLPAVDQEDLLFGDEGEVDHDEVSGIDSDAILGLGENEEPEVVTPEDDTLSLSDIADQENLDEDADEA